MLLKWSKIREASSFQSNNSISHKTTLSSVEIKRKTSHLSQNHPNADRDLHYYNKNHKPRSDY